MKKLIGLFVIIVATMAFVSCEPVEDRLELKGAISEAEIDQYMDIKQETIEGKLSNYFSFQVKNGLQGSPSFKHGLGTLVGTSNGYIQCYVVSGDVNIVFTVLNPDGSRVSKAYPYTVEECFNVAPEWALFCGSGSKTWTWDEDAGVGYHGMGDVFDDGATWWNIPDPESRVPGEGIGATMTLSADGATLTKVRTDGSTESGTFGFDMSKQHAGYSRSLGQFTTNSTNVLAGRNTKGGEFVTLYEIVKLTEDEFRLCVIDMDEPYLPDSEGWGQSTHWLFKAVD